MLTASRSQFEWPVVMAGAGATQQGSARGCLHEIMIAFGGAICKYACIWFSVTFGWIFLNTRGGRAPLSG